VDRRRLHRQPPPQPVAAARAPVGQPRTGWGGARQHGKQRTRQDRQSTNPPSAKVLGIDSLRVEGKRGQAQSHFFHLFLLFFFTTCSISSSQTVHGQPLPDQTIPTPSCRARQTLCG
jgi:hypothetical protein